MIERMGRASITFINHHIKVVVIIKYSDKSREQVQLNDVTLRLTQTDLVELCQLPIHFWLELDNDGLVCLLGLSSVNSTVDDGK